MNSFLHFSHECKIFNMIMISLCYVAWNALMTWCKWNILIARECITSSYDFYIFYYDPTEKTIHYFIICLIL